MKREGCQAQRRMVIRFLFHELRGNHQEEIQENNDQGEQEVRDRSLW
jgi:hypothetical protein